MKAAAESFNQLKQQPQHNDEFEAFGHFLASELRSLNDIGMACRKKIKLNRCFLDLLDDEHTQVQTEQIFLLENV